MTRQCSLDVSVLGLIGEVRPFVQIVLIVIQLFAAVTVPYVAVTFGLHCKTVSLPASNGGVELISWNPLLETISIVISLVEKKRSQQSLGTHYIQNVYNILLNAVKNPTGRNNNYSIRRATQFSGAFA